MKRTLLLVIILIQLAQLSWNMWAYNNPSQPDAPRFRVTPPELVDGELPDIHTSRFY